MFGTPNLLECIHSPRRSTWGHKNLVKDVIGVVFKIVGRRTINRLRWVPNLLSFELVILLAILELFADTVTHYNPTVTRVDCQITIIKQAMNIRAHQYAVRNIMALQQTKGFDVSCIQNRQGSLSSDCTAPLISLRHYETEGALS